MLKIRAQTFSANGDQISTMGPKKQRGKVYLHFGNELYVCTSSKFFEGI